MRVAFRDAYLIHPPVRNGFAINLPYVMWYLNHIWGSHSLIELKLLHLRRWNINRCSRVHTPAAPCRGLTYEATNWALKAWQGLVAPNFEAWQNKPMVYDGILKPGRSKHLHSLKLPAPSCQEAIPKKCKFQTFFGAGCQFSGDLPEISPSGP